MNSVTQTYERRIKDIRLGADVTASLYLAILQAGGIPPSNLLDMSVLELLALIAPNNIRFVYTISSDGEWET